MSNPTQADLDRIEAERARIFSRSWFARLLGGQMPVGDTFWLGNFGVAMIMVPALVVLAMIAAMISPTAISPALAGAVILTGLYRLGLLRGLWTSLRRAGFRPRGWGGTGLAITALFAVAELGYAARTFVGG